MWTDWGRRARGALHKLAMLTPLLLALQCHASAREEPTGGETHFLTRCAPGSTSCGPDLVCTCGVCSLPCSDQAACASLPNATCSVEGEGSACASASSGLCDVTCQSDPDCRQLSPSHRCAAGRCRAGEPPPSACPTGDTSANEVVILGDAFFAVEHRVTAYLEDAARASGALSIGHRYRDYSSLVGNTLALQGNGIEQQYLAAAAESAVKVVIMNGGGGDVLGGSCEVISAECPVLTAAAAGARALFERLATDSVEHVVYAFYPDPIPAELREEVSTLRPLLEAACAESPVPCEWVDLRATFEGKEDAYLSVDGTVPTAVGAEAAAGAIFAAMQRVCIAQ